MAHGNDTAGRHRDTAITETSSVCSEIAVISVAALHHLRGCPFVPLRPPWPESSVIAVISVAAPPGNASWNPGAGSLRYRPMDESRRQFLKVSALGGAAASVLGFDLTPALAQVRGLKIDRTTETRSTCPYCSVSCGVIIHTLGDRSANVTPTVVHVEGDPDHPINQGTLCPKGITLKQNIVNDRRLTKVLYRAPGGRAWEERSWDWAVDRIAQLVKESRDTRLVERDDRGRTLNALTSIGVIGGCTDTNEINYLLVKAFRAGLGVIPIEQQSRI